MLTENAKPNNDQKKIGELLNLMREMDHTLALAVITLFCLLCYSVLDVLIASDNYYSFTAHELGISDLSVVAVSLYTNGGGPGCCPLYLEFENVGTFFDALECLLKRSLSSDRVRGECPLQRVHRRLSSFVLAMIIHMHTHSCDLSLAFSGETI